MGKGYAGNPSGGFSSIGGSGGGTNVDLLDNQIPKYDLALDELNYASATVNPSTMEWTFDEKINVPNTFKEVTLTDGQTSKYELSSDTLVYSGATVNVSQEWTFDQPISIPNTFKEVTLTDGQTSKYELSSDSLIYSGATVNVSQEWTFDQPISIPNTFKEVTLTDGQVAKYELSSDSLIYAGATVNGSQEWTFDQPIDVPITQDTLDALRGKLIFDSQFSYLTSNTVLVPSGIFRDSTNVYTIRLASPMILNINVSGAGGLQTGSSQSSNTWYGAYVIGDTNGVNADNVLFIPEGVAFSQAGYDVIRSVGWVKNNAGADFFRFNTNGLGAAQEYLWDIDSQSEILAAGGATSFTQIDCSEFIPPTSISGLFQMGIVASAAFAGMIIRPNGALGTYNAFTTRPGVATTITNRSFAIMITDVDRIIEYEVVNAADDAYLSVQGFTVGL